MPWRFTFINFLIYFTSVSATSCSNIKDNKPVILISLDAIRSSNVTFNFSDPLYLGNSLSFSFDRISKLQTGAFNSSTSEFLKLLGLKNKSIEVVEDGAFASLTCLSALDLSYNLITSLSTDMFFGLGNLKTLNLKRNSIVGLQDLVFSNLKNMSSLDLSYNNISEIHLNAFASNPSLEVLDLSHNCMKHIYSVFKNLKRLRNLNLEYNGIAIINTILFKKNTLLEKLNLSGNDLVILHLMIGSFNTKSLQLFNISNNYLVDLDVAKFVNEFSNSSTTIDVNDNQFNCSDWRKYKGIFANHNITIANGRNFNARKHIQGIACDNLHTERPIDSNDDHHESESSHWSLTYAVIAVGVIGCVFCGFLCVDYVLRNYFKEGISRRVRVCLAKTSVNRNLVNSDYVQLEFDS